jgi:hypothetical protein
VELPLSTAAGGSTMTLGCPRSRLRLAFCEARGHVALDVSFITAGGMKRKAYPMAHVTSRVEANGVQAEGFRSLGPVPEAPRTAVGTQATPRGRRGL